MVDVDIILPCYNPHDGWAEGILNSMKALEDTHPDLTIGCIVVNDGSAEGFTVEDISFLIKYIPNCKVYSYSENKGKGHAVRYGIARSQAPYIMYTDIDFPFEISSMQSMLDALLAGEDIVLGHRQKSYDHQLQPFRRILSSGSHFFNKVLLGLRFIDTQGGLKCFNARGKEYMMKTKINRYLFDTEFLLLASKAQNLKIKELPIETVQGIQLRDMGFSTLRKEITGMFRLLYIKFFK
jgi:glycosyltransferase involved in cell wall biosynthesis